MSQLIFFGYASGQTDFQSLLNTTNQPDFQALDEFINRIVSQMINPDPEVKIIFLVVGLSDKNDTPGLDCDARRNSERDASRKRAQSAHNWIVTQIIERAAQNGVDARNADRSWLTEFNLGAMTAFLANPHPVNESERRDNRRVNIFVKEYPVPPGTDSILAFLEEENSEQAMTFA